MDWFPHDNGLRHERVNEKDTWGLSKNLKNVKQKKPIKQINKQKRIRNKADKFNM